MIWIGNDHGGYELKIKLLEYLDKRGIAYRDIGCHATDIVRYPYFAFVIANAVADGYADRGILICSTGIGMSIVANRRPGVRASLCTDTYMAKMTRKHNDSNILCLGGKITGDFVAVDILETWIDTPFEGGRHNISLGIIQDSDDGVCSIDGTELPCEMK